ncbi:hypothetical protein A4X09_0g2170 [Tilletia walkeri]|uniref:Uncharacterized protein n=1 Tax=Tilletia walkeri TaxID=117179 RepID=A0A8X7NBV9_9BASI|nr:hypothetical protein A4X09_0g2170 [Tilletia walkeri]
MSVVTVSIQLSPLTAWPSTTFRIAHRISSGSELLNSSDAGATRSQHNYLRPRVKPGRVASQVPRIGPSQEQLNTVRQQLLEANAQAVSERVKVEAVANDIGRKDTLLVERKPELQKIETLFSEANTQAANAVNEAAKLGSDNIKLTDELKIANRQLARAESSALVAE